MFIFGVICSSVDEITKEKFTPFATLSGDESYQSRDLEKVIIYPDCTKFMSWYG